MTGLDAVPLSGARFLPGDVIVHHAWYPDGQPVSAAAAAIAKVGRGLAYHAAVLDWTQEQGWVAIEMVPPAGREEPIAGRVRKMPGIVHWLTVPGMMAICSPGRWGWGQWDRETINRVYDRKTAVLKARSYIGREYGFDTIGRDWLMSSFGRWFTRTPADDEILDLQPVCSSLVLDALQAGFGGWDLVRNLNTALAQPEDVNRLCILEDQGGLVP